MPRQYGQQDVPPEDETEWWHAREPIRRRCQGTLADTEGILGSAIFARISDDLRNANCP